VTVPGGTSLGGLRDSVARACRILAMEGVLDGMPRPRAGAVVHAHPRAVLACGIAGLELRPVFGAYNIPAMRLAADGIPSTRARS
jgi:hypothetical protein